MGKALALRTGYRLQQWGQIVKECSESGMSNRAYCLAQGISEKNYYYWLRRLREAAADKMSPQIVEVKLGNEMEQSGVLLMRYHDAEVTVTAETPAETPAEALTTILQVLKQL